MTTDDYKEALTTLLEGATKLSLCLWGTFTNAMCDTCVYFIKHPINAFILAVTICGMFYVVLDARTERDYEAKRAYALEVSRDSLQTLIDIRH